MSLEKLYARSDLRESNFYRLLQRVRAVIDKLFDDKKQELQQQGEKQ